MKKARRWILGGLGLFLLVLAAGWFYKDSALKSFAERRLSQDTGLTIKIGQLQTGLISPRVGLKNFQIFNPAGFATPVFATAAEAFCRLDLWQARSNRLHFQELTFNLAELNLIKNKEGLLNIVPIKECFEKALKNWSNGKSSFVFGGIDKLELSLGKLNYSDQQHPENNVQIDLNIKREVATNLQTEEQLNNWLYTLLARIAFQQYLSNPKVKALHLFGE